MADPGITVERLQTVDGGPAQSGERLYDKGTGRNCQYGLTQQVQWATPKASNASKGVRTVEGARREVARGKNACLSAAALTFPTPRASEYKDCGPVGSKSQVHMENKRYLCAKVKEADKPKGYLNPDWVEWLMGVPAGWTDLYGYGGRVNGWPNEPPIPRVTESSVDRVDRIRMLGNGVVPQTAARAWEVLNERL